MNAIADRIAGAYIEKIILPSDPLFPIWNRENFVFRKTAKWNYIDNCMIKAVTMLYELAGKKCLLDYAVRFMDSYVGEDGSIPTMNISDFNLDNINGGKNLIYLFRKTGDERYKNALAKIYSQLEKQPRLANGNFWHKGIYPYQIWLDGVYMALPFMAEYAVLAGDTGIYDDIYSQLENIRRLMRDSRTGLYFHGYDEKLSQCWADRRTGLSHEFWLRSMGWLCAGLADLCGTVPESNRLYALSAGMLDGLLMSLSRYANPDGTLCQLPAKPEVAGNYPETSGTLLYAYSAVKSYRMEISGKDILESGLKAFNAVIEKYIQYEDIPVLNNICLMAGLGGAKNRDGSERYYLGERIVSNDAKGIAPYLMAYAEIKRMDSEKYE
ncbi:MAG: glycoside hydrolase family 88 protein [Ruminococcus flavefaciens]|nr:glycoside hydrolase family 88 protein [Ruminococcus flavefaciens]